MPATPIRLLSLLFLAASLSGCFVHYHYDHGAPPSRAGVSYVRQSPPPPKIEPRPHRPRSGAVWVDGYWRWTGVEYVWESGHWERRPAAGQHWVPGRWVHTNQGWYWREGHWL